MNLVLPSSNCLACHAFKSPSSTIFSENSWSVGRGEGGRPAASPLRRARRASSSCWADSNPLVRAHFSKFKRRLSFTRIWRQSKGFHTYNT